MRFEAFMAGLLLLVVSVTGAVTMRDNPVVELVLPKTTEASLWSGERPRGGMWHKCGPNGDFSVQEGAGFEGKGAALHLMFDGEGFRIAGLNWKNWYPADACTDGSKFNSLTFYVRQISDHPDIDLNISLCDNLNQSTSGPASNTLSVCNEGGIRRIGSGWQKVTLPLERFAQNKPLRLDRLWGMEFSHYGKQTIILQIDRIAFSVDQPSIPKFVPPAATSPATFAATARLSNNDGNAGGHPIADAIYGVVDLPEERLQALGVPVTRWGGNTSSRYNWKLNVDNGASDWYFKNRGRLISDPRDNAYLKLIRRNQAFGATSYTTVPMLGWVAKDDSSYSYSVRKHGPQKECENGRGDAGNGLSVRGVTLTADPNDTSVAVDPAFVAEAVQLSVAEAGYGNAPGTGGTGQEKKGVAYWALDNEPMLWHKTHRDVRSTPLGYDELWRRTVAYAEAIKKQDPSAKVAGFCSWGWTDLFYSALDEGHDQYATHADNRRHQGMPLAEWFIAMCGDYQRKHGRKLIDVFDFHWYPQAKVRDRDPYLGRGMDPALNELRLRTVRDLWDPTYRQESWIKDTADRKPTQVIRRLKQWIAKHNPGMELAVGEYNFGGGDNITGGLAQADALGVFAREKVDLAFIWEMPQGTQNLAYDLYRNYDGKGGRFGDWYVPSESTHADIAVHAARRSRDGAQTVVVLNKNLYQSSEFKLVGNFKGKLRVFRFDQDHAERVEEDLGEARAIDGGAINLKLPPASATLLVVE